MFSTLSNLVYCTLLETYMASGVTISQFWIDVKKKKTKNKSIKNQALSGLYNHHSSTLHTLVFFLSTLHTKILSVHRNILPNKAHIFIPISM